MVFGTDKTKVETRESLLEAVHELRKVAARMEIEIAVSERDQMTQKPIPIPPHRSSRKRGQSEAAEGEGKPGDNHDGGKNQGNKDSITRSLQKSSGPRRRRTTTLSSKRSSE